MENLKAKNAENAEKAHHEDQKPSNDDDLFFLGNNESLQVQVRKKLRPEFKIPIQIQTLLKISEIAAGAFHLMLLSDDGKVFTTGNNDDGQVCHEDPNQIKEVRIPDLIPKGIACGGSHSVVYSKEKLLLWGSYRVNLLLFNII